MKARNILLSITIVIFLFALQSCEDTQPESNAPDFGILPESFKVDIPASLTQSDLKSAVALKATSTDQLGGNEIYEHLGFFIAVGEEAANIVEEIIFSIIIYDIDRVKEVVYQSEDDNRVKNLIVKEIAEYNNQVWDYMLTITDAESESNPDGGKAIQIFWNKKPIEGIAILKPYNIDRNTDEKAKDAIFRITYSEVENTSYEKHMIVEIADMPLADPNIDPFSLESMKMFVGKKGDIIEVYGNSNHPNAKVFTDRIGFNWAFVASGYENTDLGVAEVGLPSNDLDSDSREVLLKENSIKNFLTDELNQYFLNLYGVRPDQDDLAAYLVNADAPGFFNTNGFVQSGIAPRDDYNLLTEAIEDLTPYNPKDLKELEINFK